MATKAIVQLHERSTTAALEADLQLRELGLDAQTNSLTVSSELDSVKWHIITKEHTAPSLDNALTLSSTLTVVGGTTLATLSATNGSFSGTLVAAGRFTAGDVIKIDINAVAVPFTNDQGSFIYTTNGGGSGIFASQGHLVIQPRSDAVRDIVFLTGVGTPTTALTIGGSGQISIPGTLSVVGGTTLAALSATNGSFSGTLGVTGASTLAALSATTGSFSSTLGVTGAVNFYTGVTCTGYGRFVIPDNSSSPFYVQQGANNYIIVRTSDGTESIKFGNDTTNPPSTFQGAGVVEFDGAVSFFTTGTAGVGGTNWAAPQPIYVNGVGAVEVTPTANNQTYILDSMVAGQVVCIANTHASYAALVDLTDSSGTYVAYVNPGSMVLFRYNGTRWYSTY